MSTERDELALILANAQRRRWQSPEIEDAGLVSETALEEADAILSAGYRKIFDGDCGLSNAAPDERDAAEAWMRWANILNTSPDEERNGISAMQQMLTEFGYRKPRTVTTLEELDEAILSAFEDAAHMVLSDSKGRPWIIWSDEDGDEVVNSWPQEGDPKRLTLGNIALPATVLSHPALGGDAS